MRNKPRYGLAPTTTMKHFLPWVARALAVAALSLCLFSEWLVGRSMGFTGSLLREVQAVFRDAETQWMVMACLVVYFLTFLLLDRAGFRKIRCMPKMTLVALVLFALLAYVRCYHTAVGPLSALTLMGGIVIGQAFAFWIGQEPRNGTGPAPAVFIAFTLVLLLAAASVWHPNDNYAAYAYLGKQRWTGPWTNPNTFGVLMGVGFVMAAGLLICFWRQPNRTWKAWLAMCLSFCAMAPLGFGLARSYSRGAWVSTLAGLAFLLYARHSIGAGTDPSPLAGTRFANCSEISSPPPEERDRERREPLYHNTSQEQPNVPRTLTPAIQQQNSLPFTSRPQLYAWAILFISLFTLLVLNFRGSENVILRRVASIGNPNDFSWRNRVASWEGALQMMAERPLFGHGWGRAEAMYDSFYKPAKLDTGAAIQMNDYLILGASLGIPALAAFVLLLLLLITGTLTEIAASDGSQMLRYTFAAAALALAIAFWFDGGLFKLSTGVVFWILLIPMLHNPSRRAHG